MSDKPKPVHLNVVRESTDEEKAAHQHRLRQTQQLLDHFAAAHGRPADTMEELEAFAAQLSREDEATP